MAADAYGRAVECDPDNLHFRMRHGALLARDGRFDEALAELVEVTATPEGRP